MAQGGTKTYLKKKETHRFEICLVCLCVHLCNLAQHLFYDVRSTLVFEKI
uniref:Uncharacterized protein n=1 Tax=Anguilla anguilla TaxID=7936 RepID=A0A0E9W172_ANGAN